MRQAVSHIRVVSFITLVMLSGVVIIPNAQAALVPIEKLPPVHIVEETMEEAVELGCQTAAVYSNGVDISEGKSALVRPYDAQPGQYYSCSEEAVAQMTVQGQIAGFTDTAGCIVGGAAGAASLNPLMLLKATYNCFNSDIVRENVIQPLAGSLLTGVVEIISWLITVFGALGVHVLMWGAQLINYAISPTKFATHEVVTTGWPFVQGIANLGFIVALLAIAFGTVFQIQDFAARRMLPRLLFAAIFINFSLLIGTVIVDASRLVMAIELRTLTTLDDVREISSLILLRSGLVDLTVKLPANTPSGIDFFPGNKPLNDGLTQLSKALFAAFIIWAAAVGFIITAVMLVVRYIAILLLLVVSPLAFLAIAMPRAGALANRWWSEFIKYVLYGPAVLFILILLTHALRSQSIFGRPFVGQQADLIQSLVSVALMIILLYMTATLSRYLGMYGAAATVGFVSGKAKQAARLYGKGAAFPARLAGRAAANQYRDASDVVKSKTRDYLKGNAATKWLVPAKRDDKGKLKPGETSLASKYAERIVGPKRKDQERQTAAQGMAAITEANIAEPAIEAPKLSNKYTIQGLGADEGQRLTQVKGIMQFGTFSQVRSVLKNKDYLRSLNDGQRAELQQALEAKQREWRRDAATGNMVDNAVNRNTHQRTLERMVDVFEQIDNE